MTQPRILDQDIRALQEWLRAAWQQLADPSLTPFGRRELRNQMKQYNADLRAHLARAAELQLEQSAGPERSFAEPEMRILSWR
jgi:autotransporter translocation and assembly factor TamB